MLLLLFAVCGCATHAPIKTPGLSSDLACQRKKQVKNDVEVMMLPIHDKQDLKAYFDEDLIRYGVLPVKVNIANLGTDPCFIGLEKDGEPFYFVFDLSGPIEQPRIKREPREEKEDK